MVPAVMGVGMLVRIISMRDEVDGIAFQLYLVGDVMNVYSPLCASKSSRFCFGCNRLMFRSPMMVIVVEGVLWYISSM
eukprot:g79966.t1